jgi:hypothetical protein
MNLGVVPRDLPVRKKMTIDELYGRWTRAARVACFQWDIGVMIDKRQGAITISGLETM